jgi:signal transduction histidine kinase
VNVRLPQTRPLQLRIALAFVGLIIGFVGAAVYVPLALWPGAERAESIQRSRAETARALGDVRGAERELRAAAVLTHPANGDGPLAREEQERAFEAARDRLRGVTEAYLRIAKPSHEIDRAWNQLADVALPALDRTAEAFVAASHQGGDPVTVRRFLEAGASFGRTLDEIDEKNAASAERDAEHIHARIRRLALGYVGLAALGTAGALLLLFQTLALLRGYASAAERRVTELDAFAGQVSHDLRSPLQSIKLDVGSIERKAQDHSLQRLAARASANVRRLDGMIRDVLHFARHGAPAQGGARADVDAVVQDLRDEFHQVAAREGVTLTVVGMRDVHAQIAPVALKTIVANLLENAIKYRRPDADRRVEVSVTADADRVVVAVKDNGVGFSATIAQRLFDPFFRGAKRPDSYGLGLATVKRLVESHQGKITVDSEQGRGSTFSVTLRKAKPPAGSQEPVRVLTVNKPKAPGSSPAPCAEESRYT